MTKSKWIIYTVLFGLAPMIGRLLIYFISVTPAKAVSVGDIIAFGLVLVITNINLLEHEQNIDLRWKTQSIGLSIILAFLMSVMFAATCFQDVNPALVHAQSMIIISAALSLSCLLFSYSVVDRIETDHKP